MPNININRRVVLRGYSSPVTNFINATGITDTTTINALNSMYNSLVGAGLYSKFYALYPMVGGTSTTTKFNFIDPRDADNAYRITWSGGLTFAATGVTPNGVNGYGNTHINNNIFTSNDCAFGVYSRTNVIGVTRQAQCACGAYSGGNGSLLYTGSSYRINSTTSLSNTSLTSQKHFAISRINSTHVNLVSESKAASSSALVSVAPVSAEINIFRLGGFDGDYDAKESAFNYICLGLTNAQLDTLTTIITTFQTALGRNV